MNDNSKWEIIHGDALKVLPQFAPDTFDAVITDPPYASGGQRKIGLQRRSIPAWEKMLRRPLMGMPRISVPGPAGQRNGYTTHAKPASPA